MRPRRLAIVTPWFAAELSGGAERLAFQVARAMHERGHDVEVFATCGRSFQSSWSKDWYAPGTSLEGGMRVTRFPLDERDGDRFDRANTTLLSLPPSALVPEAARVAPEVEAGFVDHGPRSRALEAALASRHLEFDRILFVPYLYGPTLFGLPRSSDRAVMQPCLHDEAYAYLPRIAAPVHAAARLLFNSEGERDLSGRLFGPASLAKGAVVGHWIEEPPAHVLRDAKKHRVGSRYVLYLGRRDRSKNVHVLVQAFLDFRRYNRSADLRLVLAGPGATSFDQPKERIHDLGFVGDAEKWALIAGARAIAQPSEHESFSRTMIEAWALGRPVVVHGRCFATARAVRETGGGFVASTRAEWTRTLEEIDRAGDPALAQLGAGGRSHHESYSSESRVADRYESLLFDDESGGFAAPAGRSTAARGASPFDDGARAARPYDMAGWDRPPDRVTMQRLADGSAVILYAGHAIGESDGCEALVTAFARLLSFGVDAKLAILGTVGDLRARERLREQMRRHGIESRVLLVEAPTDEVAQAYFRSARAYCSLADRPSSYVALMDASAASVPVVAFAGDGVEPTLEGSGVIVLEKSEPGELAGLLNVVLHDEIVREQALRASRAHFA